MRYHVIYLHAGQRESTHVEVADAAAAVRAVEAVQARTDGSFELLSVVPDRQNEASPGDGGHD